MKKMKMVSFILVFVLVSTACNFLSPNNNTNSNNSDGSNDLGNLPVVDFETLAQPLNVTVKLAEDYIVSSNVSTNGGSMSLTAADGTVFSLDVPAGALDVDTKITMTAVESIEGASLSNGQVEAVQLEPSGLFFNEVVTLTIIPSQEIPIENQIIFGYEGAGQDYHLAVVDPNNSEIKVKLMGFSGVGVGSGTDSTWAANLQIQGNAARVRLVQKLGEATQVERRGQILGEIPEGTDTGWAKTMESTLDQFYDQVILKEIAASELDCQYAQKAAEDLVYLERLRQLFPTGPNGKVVETIDFGGKLVKLQKIFNECKRSYSISGGAGEFFGTGTICDIERSWTVSGSGVIVTFTPTSANGGTYNYSGSMSGFSVTGTGNYTVSYQDGIAVSILAGGDGSVSDGGGSGSGDESYTLTIIPKISCP